MDDRQIAGIRNTLRKQASNLIASQNAIAEIQQVVLQLTDDIRNLAAKQEGDFQRLDGMARYSYKVTKHPRVFELAGLEESRPKSTNTFTQSSKPCWAPKP